MGMRKRAPLDGSTIKREKQGFMVSQIQALNVFDAS
jgi:hypothetical protein